MDKENERENFKERNKDICANVKYYPNTQWQDLSEREIVAHGQSFLFLFLTFTGCVCVLGCCGGRYPGRDP